MLGPQHLLPGDLVDVDDHGPPDSRGKRGKRQPARIRMHATDAKHAVSVEPDRYKLVAHPLAPPEYHHHGYATTHVISQNGAATVLQDVDGNPIYPPADPVGQRTQDYHPRVLTAQEAGDEGNDERVNDETETQTGANGPQGDNV